MKMLRKCVSLCLLLCLMLSLLPMQVSASSVPFIEAGERIHWMNQPTADTQDEELYAGHALQQFYGNRYSYYGSAAGRVLHGDEKLLYDALVPMFKEVATGQRSSAIIAVGQDVYGYPVDVEVDFRDQNISIGDFLGRVMDALLSDLPYESYWYDKVSGFYASYFTDETGTGLDQVTLYFTVAKNYRGADEFTTDVVKTGKAVKAAANAQNIVKKYEKVSDYEKLVGYLNEIMALVSYDNNASSCVDFAADIDPWQLVSVFDGDPNTNIVCEGYAKAFMYLCDMTEFECDISCNLVSGWMEGGSHMWNVVTINGKNYLVDVTCCDSGWGDLLFLVGASGSVTGGYTTSAGLQYNYDRYTRELWGTGKDSILTLEAKNYDPATSKPDTPKITKLENTASGMQITWDAVEGASLYRVFVKTSKGWTKVADTKENSYLYTAVQSGQAYSFTVRCLSKNGKTYTSDYNTTGWTYTYVAQPTITKFENAANGLKINWDKVAGADQYRVFMKTSKGWTKVADTKNTSYVYTEAKAGQTYTFTIRCLSANGKAYTSSCNTAGWKHTYVVQPEITGFTSEVNGLKLDWSNVAGAGKYRVYVKTSKGWTKLADVKGTSYVYTAAKTNTAYTFTIRALTADGKAYVGTYNTAGWKGTYSPAPEVKLANTAKGIQLNWNAINGAAKYRVFVKTSKGWTKLADTTATNYIYTAAKEGLTYTFTVRAINAAGTAYTSAYNSTGWKQVYTMQPAVTAFEDTAKGLKLSWNAVSGAGKYRVYVKTSKGWTKLADVKGTSYTYDAAKTGSAYTFTIRALTADGKSFVGTYNTTGWKHTFSPTPEVKLKDDAKGIQISWGKINGAANYRVFVKTSKGWTKLADVKGTSYTYTAAKKGQTYTFTVRCLSADGKSYTSAYNTTGWAVKHK